MDGLLYGYVLCPRGVLLLSRLLSNCMILARVIMRKVVQNGQGYAIRVVIDGGDGILVDANKS